MIRFVFLFLGLTTLLPALPAVSAPAQSVNLLTQRNRNPEDDALGIVGICSMNFGEMLAHLKEDWVVATDQPGVEPNPEIPGRLLHSGEAYIDTYPDGRNVFHFPVFGTLQIREALSGSFHSLTDHYSWEESFGGGGINPMLAAGFTFLKGPYLFLCQIHPEIQGIARYQPVYVIPPVWESQVVDAWKYVQKHPAWFEPVGTTGDPQKRAKQVAADNVLLSDDNPVLAAQAVSVLEADSAFDALGFLSSHALSARGLRQGLYVGLTLLTVGQMETHKDVLAAVTPVTQAMQAAPDANALSGLALGMSAFDIVYRAIWVDEALTLYDALLAKWKASSGQTAVPSMYVHSSGITDAMPPDEALTYVTSIVQSRGL